MRRSPRNCTFLCLLNMTSSLAVRSSLSWANAKGFLSSLRSTSRTSPAMCGACSRSAWLSASRTSGPRTGCKRHSLGRDSSVGIWDTQSFTGALSPEPAPAALVPAAAVPLPLPCATGCAAAGAGICAAAAAGATSAGSPANASSAPAGASLGRAGRTAPPLQAAGDAPPAAGAGDAGPGEGGAGVEAASSACRPLDMGDAAGLLGAADGATGQPPPPALAFAAAISAHDTAAALPPPLGVNSVGSATAGGFASSAAIGGTGAGPVAVISVPSGSSTSVDGAACSVGGACNGAAATAAAAPATGKTAPIAAGDFPGAAMAAACTWAEASAAAPSSVGGARVLLASTPPASAPSCLMGAWGENWGSPGPNGAIVSK
mmetsp:Transcript_15256/g.45680  ORF Transcript_15256/g.45680 Transcript_15256/m.45680 type:complete len:375 (-) Transcript_15256:681-1805(-)